MKDNSINTKKIALNGILGAFAVICTLLAVILPTNKMSFYALSSFFMAVIVIESGIRAGFLFYISTCILSFIIIPDKLGVLPYVIFFGLYGIVKYYIEKLGRIIQEYILKFVYFNICLGIAWFTVSKLFEFSLPVELPWWVPVIGIEVVFFLYDVVYTLFISYYREKLKPRLKL